MPPGERRGRIHTSTVTVAVLQPPVEASWSLDERDIDVRVTKDTGPGGQHRNKTESCVVMTHRPTGITAKSADRCQHQNRRQARAVLEARVSEHLAGMSNATTNVRRRAAVGTGQRGDKVRTYRVQDDLVTDHRSGRKCRLSSVVTGEIEQLA